MGENGNGSGNGHGSGHGNGHGNGNAGGGALPPPMLGAIPRGLIVLLGMAAAVVASAGLYATAWLIGPVFLALVIVITVSPLQGWLARHGWPRWLTTVVLVVTVNGLLVLLFLVMVVSVAQLADLVPRYADRAQDLVNQVMDLLARVGVEQEQLSTIASSLDLGKVASVLGSVVAAVGGLASNIVFLLALLLFLSVEVNSADSRLASIAEDRPTAAAALRDFVRGTRRYMVVATVFGLIVAVLDTIALQLLDVPLPVLWGLLAFVTNYIPNIGFIVGLVPPVLLALLEGGWPLAVAVVAVYGVVNFVVQSLIQPKFVGGAVGLSTTVAFVSLLFWAWLIGPLGAVLAIPLTLLAKALLVDVDPRARWADAIIGVRRPPPRRPSRRAATAPPEEPAG